MAPGTTPVPARGVTDVDDLQVGSSSRQEARSGAASRAPWAARSRPLGRSRSTSMTAPRTGRSRCGPGALWPRSPALVGDHQAAGPVGRVAGVLGEAAVQPTLIEPRGARRRRPRVGAVDHDRVLSETALEVLDPEAHGRFGVVEQVTQPAVAVGGVGEVQRRHRLALGHDLHERVLRHRLQGVVPASLLADRRRHRVGHRLATRRPRAVRWEDPRLVGK